MERGKIDTFSFLPRDFVETHGGLVFAVVTAGLENGRVLAFLRYLRQDERLRKIGTAEANEFLRDQCPHLLFESRQRDVTLHGVPIVDIAVHHQPRRRMAELLQSGGANEIEKRAVNAARLVTGTAGATWLGITGSLLVGAGHCRSDIDLVVYDLEAFHRVRQQLRKSFADGTVQPLSDDVWRETYDRRGCCITFADYLWHEQRKYTKFQLQGTKIDLSHVGSETMTRQRAGRKIRQATIDALVVDDRGAFAYPACYGVRHAEISWVVSYNPTYTGQVQRGEHLLAAGWLEELDDGTRQLLVGTSRESPGEYIVVKRS